VDQANQGLAGYQKILHWTLWPEQDFPRTPTQKPILPRIRDAVRKAQNGGPASVSNSNSLSGLISKITGRPVQLNNKDTNLEKDLQLSSLDRVELMSVLEEKHQVELNEAQFQDVTTVGQLEKLIGQGATATVRHAYPTWPQSRLATAFRLSVYYLLAWPATYLLAAPRVRNRENLRGLNGPVLVVSNHVTYLDIAWILPALPARFRNRLATAMGGERLARMRHPASTLSLFERFMERLRYVLVTSLFNVFPLPQQSGFLQSFTFAGNLVDRNWNVLVFPEGKTSEDGQMSAFRSGIGLLAKQLNVPVVPMYLDGLFPLKRENRILARPGQVRVAIGQPVRFSPDQDADEIAHELERRVRELQSV
jgi:long-chain acyl-CoA synthetase